MFVCSEYLFANTITNPAFLSGRITDSTNLVIDGTVRQLGNAITLDIPARGAIVVNPLQWKFTKASSGGIEIALVIDAVEYWAEFHRSDYGYGEFIYSQSSVRDSSPGYRDRSGGSNHEHRMFCDIAEMGCTTGVRTFGIKVRSTLGGSAGTLEGAVLKTIFAIQTIAA